MNIVKFLPIIAQAILVVGIIYGCTPMVIITLIVDIIYIAKQIRR